MGAFFGTTDDEKKVVTMSDDKTKIFSAMRARTQENISRQKAAEYTPTTEGVRERWSEDYRVEEFDRWLTDHDAEVRADHAQTYSEAIKATNAYADDLAEQLAAAQAVIAEARANAQEWLDSPKGEYAPTTAVGQEFMAVLAQSPTDALDAVKEAAVDEGIRLVYRDQGWPLADYKALNPYRKTEGEKL
jgi:hypothetical protein